MIPQSSLTLRNPWFADIIPTLTTLRYQKSMTERNPLMESKQIPAIEFKQPSPSAKNLFKVYRCNESHKICNQLKNNTEFSNQFVSSRYLIIEWMIHFSLNTNLNHNVTSMAVKLYDLISSLTSISNERAKLLAGTCLFIANKLEGDEYDSFCQYLITELDNITVDDIVQAELQILKLLKFNTRVITPQMYIEHMIDIQASPFIYEKIIVPMIYCLMTTESWTKYSSENIASAIIEIVQTISDVPHNISNIQCFRDCFNAIQSILASECSFLAQKFDFIAQIFVNCEL